MRSDKLTFAIVLTASGLAVAQPAPPPLPQTGTDEGAQTQPQPPPDPQPQPVQPPPPPHMEAAAETQGPRPEGLSFGIGVGYALPSDIQMPDAASVRFRLANGMTLEPRVVIGNDKQKSDNGMTSSSDSITEFGLAAILRLPMITRGKADFELLGAAGFDTLRNNPDGDDNNTSTTAIALSWGVGVGFWLSPHWQLSFSATNPLISYTSQTREMGPTMSTKTSTTSLGLIFDPSITIMIHLYN